MASILRVDTLTDASSNNSTTMSTINQGTAKAWVNLNGTGTVAINSSFNTSGITDEGTGHYSHSFTNNFADAHYVGSGSAMFSTSSNLHTITIGDNSGAAGTVPTSSSYELRTPYIAIASVTPQDCTRITVGNVGDLA